MNSKPTIWTICFSFIMTITFMMNGLRMAEFSKELLLPGFIIILIAAGFWGCRKAWRDGAFNYLLHPKFEGTV